MDEKIILSIQNPKDVLISYVDIYLGDKNVSMEVLSQDHAKINLPFDRENGEGELIIKIKYKTLPDEESSSKIHGDKINTNRSRASNGNIYEENVKKNENSIIIADSKPIPLEELKKEKKKKKITDIIIV